MKWIIFAGLKIAELIGIPALYYVLCVVGKWSHEHGLFFMRQNAVVPFWLYGFGFISHLALYCLAMLLVGAFISMNMSLSEKLYNK